MPGTYYTGAWDAAGTRFLYVVPDHAMRPWQVREHILGTPADTDRLVLQEDDESFEVTVRATRSGEWIVIESRSRDTSECWLLPTRDTTAAPRSVAGRRRGTEYTVDHAPWGAPDARIDELLMVTNDEAPEFRVLAAATDTLEPWREVVAHDPAVRVIAADAFAGHVVLTLRRDGLPMLRVAQPRLVILLRHRARGRGVHGLPVPGGRVRPGCHHDPHREPHDAGVLVGCGP